MHIYYPDLPAIEQQTRQLQSEQCRHCQQTHQLISHGMVYKKRVGGQPQAVGKRVFCSNRNRHTGCGRTMRFYLDTTVRYLHCASWQVVAFVLALMTDMTVQQAYFQTTGTTDPRHAYRWLNRLFVQLSSYRSLWHRPAVALADASGIEPAAEPVRAHRPVRRNLLTSTFEQLVQHFGQPLCAHYQLQLQRSFL